jgi:hypothetical protein
MNIETIRTEALGKLGRNIVNFSKIEGFLKYWLPTTKIEGNIVKSSELPDKLLVNRAKNSKKTLGNLVRYFNENILGDTIQSDFPEDDSGQVSISFNISCSDKEFLERKKQEFLDVVAERNKLIHQDLANLDTSSIEDYRRLIIYLDEQNPRLLNYLAELGEIVNIQKDLLKDCLELIEDALETNTDTVVYIKLDTLTAEQATQLFYELYQ